MGEGGVGRTNFEGPGRNIVYFPLAILKKLNNQDIIFGPCTWIQIENKKSKRLFEKKRDIRERGWWGEGEKNWWCRQRPTTDWRGDYRAICRWNEEAEICNLNSQSSILIFSFSRVGKKSRGSSNSAESTFISSSRGLMVWRRFIFLIFETLVIRYSIPWRCWKPKQWKIQLGFSRTPNSKLWHLDKNYTTLRIVLERLSCWGQFVTCNSEMFEILSRFFSFVGVLSIYKP